MRKALATCLPVMIVLAAACAYRHDSNRNLPPRANEPAQTRTDLKPNDTPNPGTASGPVTTGTNTGAMPQKSESPRDQQITRDVRDAIAADRALSTVARSVDVTTSNGVVTLRGSVANEQEKKTVADKAQVIAGVLRVDNQLFVEPIR